MSLSALPTEVDKIIADFLNREELKALCLTSKYYKDLAEPYLYSAVWFHSKDSVGAYLLTRTLLDCPSLAEYIKTLEVYQKSEVAVPEGSHHEVMEREKQLSSLEKLLQTESQNYARVIVQTISSAWPRLNGDYKKWWKQCFHALQMDECISVIATLALNLEHLTLALLLECPCRVIFMLLMQYRPPITHGTEDRRAFSHLKALDIIAKEVDPEKGSVMSWVPYAPSQTLYIRNLSVDHFEYPLARPITYLPTLRAHDPTVSEHELIPMPAQMVPTLRVLELERVTLYPREFWQDLCLGYFGNLEQFILRKVASRYHWSGFALDEFSNLLAQCCPNLSLLYFSVWWDEPDDLFLPPTSPPKAKHPFGSLKVLENLTCVSVDVELMFNTGDASARSKFMNFPNEMFPANIETLELFNVRETFVIELIRLWRGYRSWCNDWTRSLPQLRQVTFHLVKGTNASLVRDLQRMAEEIYECELSVEVYEMTEETTTRVVGPSD